MKCHLTQLKKKGKADPVFFLNWVVVLS